MDVPFGHWLAGFLDGEGHFAIRRDPTGGHRCVLMVNLRADDEPILLEVARRTGVGSVYAMDKRGAKDGSRPQVRWEVARKADVIHLATVLDDFPLRSKKARDFAIWREAVAVWATVRGRGARPANADGQARLAELAALLRATRRFG